jgi:predicted phage terminase large subunit-like protein
MAALQYVDVPGYAAIIFRRTYTDLTLPGALIPRAESWLAGTKAKWSDKAKTWHFPSGATLSFGYLQTEVDKYRYGSSEFQFIGFDELTQFRMSQYLFLFSRLRRLANSLIPIRMRSGSNPGGIGHKDVKDRFITNIDPNRVFIPARLDDNPFIDRQAYTQSLSNLDPLTRERLLNGDWEINEEGMMFRREWFEIVPQAPAELRKLRYWDLAATKLTNANDPDWTAGALLGEKNGIYYIMDMKHVRETPLRVEQLTKQTAMLDGMIPIYMEQEPGASGVQAIDHYRREILKGFDFHADKKASSKILRAKPLSAAAESGNVKIVQGNWNEELLDEFEVFPQGTHDDQVDSVSGAFDKLNFGNQGSQEGYEVLKNASLGYVGG